MSVDFNPFSCKENRNVTIALLSLRLPVPQEKFTPVKYFSIDRVFRNETLDATHLAEFHQIEGVVADYGLTLGDLMGILHQFFTKLGEGGLHDTVMTNYC